MSDHTKPPSHPGLPASLSAVDWHAVPQRSVLMAVTRAVRSGWRPGADVLAEIIAYCQRALSGHDRLAHRGRETLQALGVPSAVPMAERPGERNVGGLRCPACKSPAVHPGRGSRWTCSTCGQALVLRGDGRLRQATAHQRLRGAVR